MKCPFCQHTMNPMNTKHVYICRPDLPRDESRFQLIQFNATAKFDRNEIEKLYIADELSLVDLSKKYGIRYPQMAWILSYYGIPQRKIGEACSTELRNQKYRDTCKAIYGVDNASKNESVKEKKRNTFTENYGVDNIFAVPGITDTIHQTMLERYGKKSLPNRYGKMKEWWDSQTKEYKKAHMIKANIAAKEWWDGLETETKNQIITKRCSKIVSNYNSKLENRISDILANANITHTRQFWIARRSYDIRINGTRLIIEVNGDYWHANPDIYNPDDALNIGGTIYNASDIWVRDKIKSDIACKYGYTIMVLWETDINAMDDETILAFIIDNLDSLRQKSNTRVTRERSR